MKNRSVVFWALGFGLLFTAVGTVQKLILGLPLLDVRFFFPTLVGLATGALIGKLLRRNSEKNRFLENVLDGIRAPFLVIDVKDHSIVVANKAAKGDRLPLPLTCHELSHHRKSPCEGPEHTCPIVEIRKTGRPVTVEHEHFTADGSAQTVEVHAYPIFDEHGKLTNIIEYAIDITERLRVAHKLRENQERLDYLAHHDALTGLPNRSLFLDRLGQAIAQSHRKRRWVVLLFLDLDQIKAVNDTLGHPAGDALLKTIAERLSETVFEGDTVARLGGDEFTIIIEEVGSQDEASRVASRVAQKLLNAIASPLEITGRELVKTASIGIALYPQDGENADELIKHADTAMYHAKSQGGNGFQFYSAQMNADAMQRLVLESALRKSLGRNELALHFQPQFDLESGEIIGVEALLRWQSDELGDVSPNRFIPVAEETGLIVPIGRWVLEQACSLAEKLRAADLRPLRVAVNLSPRQFQQQDLADEIFRILSQNKLEPALLELEITENIMMRNPDQAVATLRALKGRGVCISCDDFGIGYSSLSYIHRLPLDAVKIDRSFIHDIGADLENSSAVVTTIIAMARGAKLNVIAEGVETETQANFLRSQGCPLVQGFLYGKPMPAEELLPWLKHRQGAVRTVHSS